MNLITGGKFYTGPDAHRTVTALLQGVCDGELDIADRGTALVEVDQGLVVVGIIDLVLVIIDVGPVASFHAKKLVPVVDGGIEYATANMDQRDVEFYVPVVTEAVLIGEVKAITLVIKVDGFVIVRFDIQRIGDDEAGVPLTP